MQPAKSLFDRLMDFAGALLLGILVNALPAIVNKVKEIVDNIVNFLTPIQSGFNLVKGFFTGDLNESKYDVDKKRFSDGMDNINEQIDKVSEKMGPLGEIIKIFKPVVDLLGFGGKKVVLAKQDDKEGFLNKETGAFTEKQFTSEERTRYESQNKSLFLVKINLIKHLVQKQLEVEVMVKYPIYLVSVIGSEDGPFLY